MFNFNILARQEVPSRREQDQGSREQVPGDFRGLWGYHCNNFWLYSKEYEQFFLNKTI